MKTWNKHAWTPRLSGASPRLYCSPACGGRCTFAAFNRAHELGKRLAEKLGKPFQVHVWENLGWHVKVVATFGDAQVTVMPRFHDGRLDHYSVSVFAPGVGQHLVHEPDPLVGLRLALAAARRRAEEVFDGARSVVRLENMMFAPKEKTK